MTRQLRRVAILLSIIVLAASTSLAQSLPKAQEFYNEALNMFHQADSTEDLLTAKQNFEKALTEFKMVNDLKMVGYTSGWLGSVESRLEHYRQAVVHFEESLEIMKRVGDVKKEAATLKNLADAYEKGGNDISALGYYEECLALQRKLGDVQGQEETLIQIAKGYEHLRQYEKALEANTKLFEMKEKHENVYDLVGRDTLTKIAEIHKILGNNEKASEFYEKAIGRLQKQQQLVMKNGNVQLERFALHNIAMAYKSYGKYQKALEHFEKELEIVKMHGRPYEESYLLRKIADVYKSLGQTDKASEFLEESKSKSKFKKAKFKKATKKDRDPKDEVANINSMGHAYKDRDNYVEALASYEMALEKARSFKYAPGEAITLNNIGAVYAIWGQYSKSLEYYEKALEIAENIGDVSLVGLTLGHIGNARCHLAEYFESLECFEKALEIAENIGEVSRVTDALNDMGNICFAFGQYSKSLEYYEKAVESAEKVGDVSEVVSILGNIATVYQALGRYTKALTFFQNGLELNKRSWNVSGEATYLSRIGHIYHSLGQHAKSLEYHEKSLEINRRMGRLQQEGYDTWSIADVCMATGKYDAALTGFRKTLDIFTRIGVPIEGVKDSIGRAYLEMGDVVMAELFIAEAGYYASMGQLSLVKHDFKRALTQYADLLTRSLENRNSDNLFIAYTGLGRAYECLHDYPNAEASYRKAVDAVEEVRSGLAPAERENFFSVKSKGFYRTDPYDGLVRVFIAMNRPLEALKQSEYTKARLFSESLSRRTEGITIGLPEDIQEKDSHLNDRLAAVTKNLQQAYEKGNEEVIASLESQVEDMKVKLAAHIDILRKHHPLFAANKYPLPMDLAQTTLSPNEWVLEYHVTDTGVAIYLAKGKALFKALFKPIEHKDLDRLVESLKKPLTIDGAGIDPTKPPELDLKIGKKLSDLLIGEMLNHIPKGVPIIIIPDDCLGVLPFEMLVLDESGKIVPEKDRPQVPVAQFFGDRNPLSYYQSITALTLTRQLRRYKGLASKTLVIDDPIFGGEDDSRVKRMAQTEREKKLSAAPETAMSLSKEIGLEWRRLGLTANLGRFLEDLYPGKVDRYTGRAAVKEVLLQKSLNDYESMIFATHGYFGKDLPGIQEPVLVLTLIEPPEGQDGFLRLREVMGLKIKADIVVLTACNTGVGKQITGEGTMGMGRAFQFAGAKSVLMTLWPVAQRSSVMLVEEFFRYRKAGKSKLEALKLARDVIRKQGYDHPYYWAPFILVGEID